MDIDFKDLAILRCIANYGHPLWKNKIHECCEQYLCGSVSVQTVGRRVDQLHDAGLLTSCIVSPDSINRDLIIAFKLTDDGRTALHHKRREILMKTAQKELFENKAADISDDTLNELIAEEFRLGEWNGDPLDDHGREELLALTALHYAVQRAEDTFTEETRDRVAELAERSDDIAEVLSHDLL